METTSKQAAVAGMVAAFGSLDEAMAALRAAYTKSLPSDESAFASLVLATANKCQVFGERHLGAKVLIGHVVAALRADGYAFDVYTFKARLVTAHRTRALYLTRCDMVQVFSPEDIESSETEWLNARFHFVEV